ncbi:MAG: cytochrome bc complex cytochrome b subunit [Aquificales bacterium]|nr:cytochrome bc complex cytochrome b subunit [Aquificales bacterium]
MVENQPVRQQDNLFVKIIDWMDERFQVRALADSMLHVYIPREAKTFYLGGITLFLFLVQVITGSLLALYYQPTPDTAYDSVLFIMSNVNFGWLIRSIHAWGANLMVIFCVLHLLRVFFQGAYKKPREATWFVGVLLLAVTLGFGFTGYLLPWDQRAYWATTVGSESAGAVPIIGEFLLEFMRGGMDITKATLSRFYGIHTLLLPLTLAGMLGAHLLLMHQQGIANPNKPAKRPSPSPDEENETQKEKTLPFFPHYVLSEVIAWYMILGLLIILASLFPAGLEEKANALETPAHIKPEWYFLSVYQFLKKVPEVLGVLAPMLAFPILFFLPFIDRNPEVVPRKRPVAITLGVVTLALITGFTIWGWLS